MSNDASEVGLSSYQVEDVTEHPDRREQAFRLLTSEYQRFASQQVTPEQLRRDLCDDDYFQNGLARTIAIFGSTLDSPLAPPSMLATMRIVLTHDMAPLPTSPFEMMRILTPQGGWEEFRSKGFDSRIAAEYGRFAINPLLRLGKSQVHKQHLAATKVMVEWSNRQIQSIYGKSQAWSIASTQVAKMVADAGLEMQEIPGTTLNVAENQLLFENYAKYWKSNTISLYRFIF